MKQVLECPKLSWGECYSSLPLSIYGAISFTSKRSYSLTDVLVHTTHAFRTSVNKDVYFTGAYDLDWITGRALRNLGFDSTILQERQLAELTPELQHQAMMVIRDSVDSGIPVIGHNLDNYEYGLIYGYDDEQKVLHICDISARSGKELPYDQLGKRPLHGTPIPPELTLIALKDRDEVPYVSVDRQSGGQDDSYRLTLNHTIFFLIEHLTDQEPIVGGFVNGLNAFDTWSEAFRNGNVHAMGNAYNIMLFANVRKFALRFLIDSSQPDFWRVHDIRLQQLMAEAAVRYTESYNGWIKLRHRFPFDQVGRSDLANSAVIEETVRDLQQIKRAESGGLELFQQMHGLLNG